MSSKNRKLDNTPVPQRQEGVPVLDIQDLNVSFPSEDGVVRAVRGVNLKVHPGEVLGIVGESGSGKSVTSLAVMGLLDESAKVEGSVKLHGTEILGKSDAWMSKIRGKKSRDGVSRSAICTNARLHDWRSDRGSLDHSPEDEQDRGARASD